MNMQEKYVCPFCGNNREFVTGKQVNESNVVKNKVFTIGGQALYHIICLKCGTVVRSFVSHPEKLL